MWYCLNDTLSCWAVEEGTLKALGLGGELRGDIISVDWKISSGGNSGILYMVQEDTAYDAVYKAGPEFQQIVRDVVAKYQAEHERVRKWLEEQGMLQVRSQFLFLYFLLPTILSKLPIRQ